MSVRKANLPLLGLPVFLSLSLLLTRFLILSTEWLVFRHLALSLVLFSFHPEEK